MRLSIVILPEARWSVAKDWWRMADEYGFHTAWTYDHLTWRSFQDDAWFGATTTLAAAALATRRVRIGPLVASPNFRHPVAFAKEIMGLDDLSDGRFTLGLGSGGTGFDATALGGTSWNMQERTARFIEFSEQLNTLLRSPTTTELRGSFYAADEARNIPGCVQKPRVPFVLSAFGPRGMALTANLADGWVTTGGDLGLREAARQLNALEVACVKAGRSFASLDRHFLTGFDPAECWLDSVASYTDLAGRAAELGFTDVILHRARNTEPFLGNWRIFEDIASAS
jgi:alkanesulfonate monooxygenase SsuD/methylene tetrahydromethanopterin reductase-like flavin-dependent oxidoreductase (luciferase family)